MTKIESIMIGIVLGILCPLLLTVLFWWSSAVIYNYHILPITERTIVISAITGFVIGIILDILYIRRWVSRFYLIDLRLMVMVYLFCSAIATAFCMGLPFGNILLGMLAGVYIGRKSYHSTLSVQSFSTITKDVSFLTAIVTGLWTIFIGLLALNEAVVKELLQKILQFAPANLTELLEMLLVFLLSFTLAIVQFLLTKIATCISFRLGSKTAT